MTGLLPTPEQRGLTYDGPCPELRAHGFSGGLYTEHGQGLGRPVFQWRARPMYWLAEGLAGLAPYDVPWDEQRRLVA